MKRLFPMIALAVWLFPFNSSGQEEEKQAPSEDTTRFKIGDSEFIIIDPEEGGSGEEGAAREIRDRAVTERKERAEDLTHWNGFEVTVNGYVGPDRSPELPERFKGFEVDIGRSVGFGFNFWEEWFPLAGDHFGVVTGLGVGVYNYSLEEKYVLRSSADTTVAVEDSVEYDRNKLKTVHIKLPLLLEVNTSTIRGRNFHFSAGAVGTWRTGARFKRKFEAEDGSTVRSKLKDDFNLNRFQVNGVLRIGYENFAITGEYGFLPLFDKERAPELNSYTVGLAYEF